VRAFPCRSGAAERRIEPIWAQVRAMPPDRVETASAWSVSARRWTPPVVAAIIEHELEPELVGEDPMFRSASMKRSTTVPGLFRAGTRGAQPEVTPARYGQEAIAGWTLPSGM